MRWTQLFLDSSTSSFLLDSGEKGAAFEIFACDEFFCGPCSEAALVTACMHDCSVLDCLSSSMDPADCDLPNAGETVTLEARRLPDRSSRRAADAGSTISRLSVLLQPELWIPRHTNRDATDGRAGDLHPAGLASLAASSSSMPPGGTTPLLGTCAAALSSLVSFGFAGAATKDSALTAEGAGPRAAASSAAGPSAPCPRGRG
mmetsp:Transcript_127406/g.354653  ORF Transcript_127406/g.354653 Transcript_127406/m.354653 type:complete len:203 (-) Transcript_127406:303-911(-)